MRIPHTDRLKNQTFTNEKVELVWQFGNQQFLFSLEKGKNIYMEAGEVNGEGDYLEKLHWAEFPIDVPTLTVEKIWQTPELFKYQNFFMTGSQLVPLTEDLISYFK
jgi:hypothetical protein